MEFVFETMYNQKGISVMAEALRKTIRKKKSKKQNLWAILIIILVVILTIPKNNQEFVITFNLVITWLAVIVMVFTFIFQDKINGYFARKRMIAGMEKSITTFKEESYISATNIGKTEFYYKNIFEVVESNDYFIFIFDKSHAQIYDKNGITKGNIDEFRTFIAEKTDKEIQKI